MSSCVILPVTNYSNVVYDLSKSQKEVQNVSYVIAIGAHRDSSS